MEPEALKNEIIRILEDKNGGDITDIYVAEKTVIADYFVIATGKNVSHVRALAEEVESKMEAQGVFVLRKEGLQDGRWVVLDYGSVLVHVFNAETRDFYCLEKLWK